MIRCPVHDIPDCSPLLNGCSRVIAAARAMSEDVVYADGMDNNDRTVHGWDALGNPVVRYDKRSHWYVEPKEGSTTKRRRLTIAEAAHKIHLGREASYVPSNLRKLLDAEKSA